MAPLSKGNSFKLASNRKIGICGAISVCLLILRHESAVLNAIDVIEIIAKKYDGYINTNNN